MSELGFHEGRAFFPKRRSFKEANVLRSEKVANISRFDAANLKQGHYFLAMPFLLGCGVNLPSSPSSDFSESPQKNADGGVLNSGNDLSSATRETHPTMPP